MGQTSTATGPPPVAELLAAAVSALGGSEREGQQQMAGAVERSLRTGEHLAVQAGTGTGKSLAYLVPAIRHALEAEQAVVVSTATIALQTQLVDRDLPRLTKALAAGARARADLRDPQGPRPTTSASTRSRRGAQAAADDPGDEQLFDPFQVSALGRQVTRLHEWAEQTTTGDRDELVPGVTDRAWRQVSVSARECLGASRCPVAEDCFSEHARRTAGSADVVVTNHAMLAIDAIEGRAVLPDHDVVVVDEAHNLVDRVTSVATGELTAAAVERRRAALREARRPGASRRAARRGRGSRHGARRGRPGTLGAPARGRRADADGDPRRGLVLPPGARSRPREKGGRDDDATARKFALALVEEVHDVAGRLLTAFDREDPATRPDVVWCSETERNSTRTRALHVAPLSVAGLLASRLFGRSTVVLTSATLALGGSFDALARQWGLPAGGPAKIKEPIPDDGSGHDPTQHADKDPATNLVWHGLDVGSPFAHGKAGILYVARHLPPPGRDGLSAGVPRRDRGPRARRGRPGAGAVLVDARREAGRRGPARPLGRHRALPGRRRDGHAGDEVRRRRRRACCSGRCRCGRASTCPASRCSSS